MSRILLTGGAGFIGSHVAERLLADGHSVTVVDNFDDFYDEAIKRDNIARACRSDRYRLCRFDIRDPVGLEAALGPGPPDAIIHLAARAGVRPSLHNPALYEAVNVAGTLNLLELARRHHVPRFIFGSSSSVYGNNARTPFREDDNVDHPISPYAATKRAGELLCYTYHDLYGINVTCLRIFTAHGPRCRPDLAIPKFVRLIEAGQAVPMYGDGSSQRDYTYVGDIVDGIVRALGRCRGYRIYNLGSGCPVSLGELIQTIAEVMDRPVRIRSLPAQPGDVRLTHADISRARQELGYQPRTSLVEGIRRYVHWYQRVLSRV
ncbi:MAG: GDP-mannose 4,6-dehydratase [Phycisphaerae bacterium]